MPVKIRTAASADLPFIVDLERAAETAAHWREEEYRELFDKPATLVQRLVLIAEEEKGSSRALPNPSSSPLGFLVARHVASEWELENIVVAPSVRRMGVGRQLMGALVTWAIQTESHSILLEVRESNVAARRLYEQLEFQETGRRKSYYANPLEGAILYTRTL